MLNFHLFFSFSHRFFHEILERYLAQSIGNSKDAHSWGAYGTVSEKVETWMWFLRGARSVFTHLLIWNITWLYGHNNKFCRPNISFDLTLTESILGGESIHRAFNTLHYTHASLNDKAKRLQSILKRHHLNVYPELRNKEIKPKIVRRGPYKKKPRRTVAN